MGSEPLTRNLLEWEKAFQTILADVPSDRLRRGGVLADCLPSLLRWEQFKVAVRYGWTGMLEAPQHFPHSLVFLFSGIAFFDYSDRSFWDAFSDATGDLGLVEVPRASISLDTPNGVFLTHTEVSHEEEPPGRGTNA